MDKYCYIWIAFPLMNSLDFLVGMIPKNYKLERNACSLPKSG